MSSQILKVVAAVMLIGSLILAVVAWRLARTPQTQPLAVTPASPPPPRTVIVAKRPLRAGETLAAGDISLAPVATAPAGAIEKSSDAIGRHPVTDIPQGEPLLKETLLAANPLAQTLHDDERAIAIKVDEIVGVGGFVQPGDRVDVIAFLRPDGQRIKDNQAMIVLHAVRVLAYGEELQGTGATAANTEPAESTKSRKGRSTTVLAIKTEDAPRLSLTENAGILRLALRPLDERGESTDPHAITLTEIAKSTTREGPSEQPKGREVRIHHGGKLTTQFQLP